MENIALSERNMNDYTNSDLIKHIATALFNIVSRRTSKSYLIMILTDVIRTLRNKLIESQT